MPVVVKQNPGQEVVIPKSVKIDVSTGPRIREYLLEKKPPTAAEIAREGGFTRQYAWRVLDGRERPSKRFIEACERLGIPVIGVISSEV